MTPQELNQLNGPIYQECVSMALNLAKERNLAMDIVQEAYYLATKYQHKFQEGTNLRRWIKTIVYNVFISDYRQTKRRRELIATKVPANSWMNRGVVDNSVVGELAAEDLTRLIDSVPGIFRQSFILLTNGMTYQQISDRLKVPVGTIKSRVFTARKILKEGVYQRGKFRSY